MNTRHVIELSPSGKTLEIGDELLLDAMLASGLAVPFSCRRGACGSCKVVVAAGEYRAKRLAPDAPAPCYPWPPMKCCFARAMPAPTCAWRFPAGPWIHLRWSLALRSLASARSGPMSLS